MYMCMHCCPNNTLNEPYPTNHITVSVSATVTLFTRMLKFSGHAHVFFETSPTRGLVELFNKHPAVISFT